MTLEASKISVVPNGKPKHLSDKEKFLLMPAGERETALHEEVMQSLSNWHRMNGNRWTVIRLMSLGQAASESGEDAELSRFIYDDLIPEFMSELPRFLRQRQNPFLMDYSSLPDLSISPEEVALNTRNVRQRLNPLLRDFSSSNEEV